MVFNCIVFLLFLRLKEMFGVTSLSLLNCIGASLSNACRVKGINA
jgi:hypothetical protein